MKRTTVNKYLVTGMAAALFCGPIAALLIRSFSPGAADEEALEFILGSKAPMLVGNTLLLLPAVLLPSAVLGIFQAWVVVHTNIPFPRLWNTLFILPLCFPLYVISFVYTGLLEYSGPLPTWLRAGPGWDLHQYLNVQSLPALAAIFSLTLAPYIYLAAKNAFARAGKRMPLNARTLGKGPGATFFSVILPYSKPWLYAAAALVAMETLADFGGVSVFNYETLTTAIYETWSSLFSLATAARLSAILLLLALFLLWAEGTASPGDSSTPPETEKLPPLFQFSWAGRLLGLAACGGICLLSLGVPLAQLLWWSLPYFNSELTTPLLNSLALSTLGAALICPLALTLAFFSRHQAGLPLLTRASLLGYALPGALIAVAVFSFFAPLAPALLPLLFLGYTTRFLGVALRPQNNSLRSIPRDLERAARSLGARGWRLVRDVHLPLMRAGALSAFLLCFIEILKEMPMTLMLRPMHLSTLATDIYEFTSEGQWERAAPGGLLIVLAGMLPTFFLPKLEKP